MYNWHLYKFMRISQNCFWDLFFWGCVKDSYQPEVVNFVIGTPGYTFYLKKNKKIYITVTFFICILFVVFGKKEKAEQSLFELCSLLSESIRVGETQRVFTVIHAQCTIWHRVFFISQDQRFALGAASNQSAKAVMPPSFPRLTFSASYCTFKLAVVTPLLRVTNDEMFVDWFSLEDELAKPRKSSLD